MKRRQEVGNFTLGNTDSIRQHILQLLETDILSCGGRSLTSFGIVLLNADEIHQQSSVTLTLSTEEQAFQIS